MYRCPDCQAIHDEATDAILGHVMRCPHCFIAGEFGDVSLMDVALGEAA